MKKKKIKESAKSDDPGKPEPWLFRRRTISCSTSGLLQLKIATAFGQRVFRCPAPRYFIGLSSATLSYFTYSVVFLHNTKYPTTRPHRRTNPPHHAPAGTKHPFTHRPNHSSLPPCTMLSPFAIHLVASPAAVALRPSLEKIKRYRVTLFIFNKGKFWSAHGALSPIYFCILEKCFGRF